MFQNHFLLLLSSLAKWNSIQRIQCESNILAVILKLNENGFVLARTVGVLHVKFVRALNLTSTKVDFIWKQITSDVNVFRCSISTVYAWILIFEDSPSKFGNVLAFGTFAVHLFRLLFAIVFIAINWFWLMCCTHTHNDVP